MPKGISPERAARKPVKRGQSRGAKRPALSAGAKRDVTKTGGDGSKPFVRCEYQATRIREARGVGCSIESCAIIEGLPESTLRKHYDDCLHQPPELMKRKLRAVQYSVAVDDRNPRMLEWLGKQMLGQTDKQQFDGNLTYTANQILQDLDGRSRGIPGKAEDS